MSANDGACSKLPPLSVAVGVAIQRLMTCAESDGQRPAGSPNDQYSRETFDAEAVLRHAVAIFALEFGQALAQEYKADAVRWHTVRPWFFVTETSNEERLGLFCADSETLEMDEIPALRLKDSADYQDAETLEYNRPLPTVESWVDELAGVESSTSAAPVVTEVAEDTKKERGLYKRYHLERVDGSSAPGGKHEHCRYLVADITHDPFAVPAVLAYAHAAEKGGYGPLARDLRAWLPTPVAKVDALLEHGCKPDPSVAPPLDFGAFMATTMQRIEAGLDQHSHHEHCLTLTLDLVHDPFAAAALLAYADAVERGGDVPLARWMRTLATYAFESDRAADLPPLGSCVGDLPAKVEALLEHGCKTEYRAALRDAIREYAAMPTGVMA